MNRHEAGTRGDYYLRRKTIRGCVEAVEFRTRAEYESYIPGVVAFASAAGNHSIDKIATSIIKLIYGDHVGSCGIRILALNFKLRKIKFRLSHACLFLDAPKSPRHLRNLELFISIGRIGAIPLRIVIAKNKKLHSS